MSQQDHFGPSTGPLQSPQAPPHGGPGYPQEHGRPGYEQPYGEPGWQPGYGEQAYDQHGYPPAGSPPPGYGYGYDLGPRRTNVMAILGLVFAFLFSPLGIVFSAIGLGQVKRRNEKGRGLALSGLILSILFLVIGVLFALVVVPAATKAVNTAAEELSSSGAPSPSASDAGGVAGGQAESSGAPAGSGGPGVAAACKTIIPALMSLEADMQDVHPPAQYSQALSKLESTLTTAASGASDSRFQQDVAALNADLEKASAAVQAGKDPSTLESALSDDGAAIGEACATAGVTG